MKSILTSLIFFLFSIVAYSQDSTNGKYYYSDVVHVEGATKDELYQRGIEWVTNTFRGPKTAIQIQDKEAGNIVCKGVFEIPLPAEDYVFYSMRIIVKDGRYKYILSNMYHEGTWNKGTTRNAGLLENDKPACGRSQMAGWYWNKVRDKADEKAQELIKNLVSQMSKKSQIEDF